MRPLELNRAVEIAGFLSEHHWDEAEEASFSADFSSRRYARLTKADGQSAILMDADADQKTTSFVLIAKLLFELGLSAPKIIAAQAMRGLVLMEDLGNKNLGMLIDNGHASKPLYLRATDVLIHIHKKFNPSETNKVDLPLFGGALFSTQVEIFLDCYFSKIKQREATVEESESFRAAWKEALKGIEALPQTLMLRDFMPDNLMDLADREGARSIGVLDFQDAGLGPIAYDLASLCEVVRREGGGLMIDEVVNYYLNNTHIAISQDELRRSVHVLSAQRHMRILGIIARILTTNPNSQKLAYLWRIWNYLDELLKNDKLKAVQSWINTYMPPHERNF